MVGMLADTLRATTGAADDVLGAVPTVVKPMLTLVEFVIPIAVVASAIHKLMRHEESGVGFFVDLVIKAGGFLLIVLLTESVVGVH